MYLDDILIFIKNLSQSYVKAVRWMLNVLKKHKLFANLKKCRLHKNKIYFLGHIILAQEVRTEDNQIETVKN